MIEFTCITQESGTPLISYEFDVNDKAEVWLLLGMLEEVKSKILKELDKFEGELK